MPEGLHVPELIASLLRQVPALVVLAYMIVKFLQHMQRRDELMSQTLEARDAIITAIHDECRQTTRETVEVVRENTRMLAEVQTVLRMLNGRKGGPSP